MMTGNHYLGGFIGDREAEERWLVDKITGLAESVDTLAGVSHKHPQSAYVGLQKSLQQECSFMQRVTPGISNIFSPVDKDLRETFVPALFKGLGDGVPERGVTCLSVKQAVLALPDPTQTDPDNWTASCVIIGHVVATLRGQLDFQIADHSACLREGRPAVRRVVQRRAKEALADTLEGALVQRTRRLQWVTKVGAWLTVQPSTVNGTDLGAQEWLDALFLPYGLNPPDLPTHCDGCNYRFTISRTLDCKRDGLFMARHNELRDGVADLAGKAFTLSYVRDNPIIYSSRAVKSTKATPAGAGGTTDQAGAPPPEVMDQKGDLLIHDLWQNGTDSVHDMSVVNTDAKSHIAKAPEKCQ